MNKYIVSQFFLREDPTNIQRVLIKYNTLTRSEVLYRNFNYTIDTITNITVIDSHGPELVRFIGDQYYYLENKDLLCNLELTENDSIFEANNDEDAKLIYEVGGYN